jgi:4-amino-4-deoxy-L-arabinose transferase-like glycosyltransferase
VQLTKLAKPEWHHLVALALLCAGIFFFELGRLPLIGPDEPRYAEVAKEMYFSGDWITPRLGGIHWFEKPALLYWMVAASYTVFGVSEWSSRVSIALAAAVGALLLFFFGHRMRSARFGYLSAAALAASGLWVGFGRAATFDMPLSVTIELALIAFFVWDSNQSSSAESELRSHSNRSWWACCFALGLAVLAKGIVGLLLPAAIIGLYLIITRRLSLILKRPLLLLLGALFFILTASAWYGPMLARHGSEFIEEFFIAHHFERFLTNKYRHPQPFYFFFVIALLGCFPWSLHLAAGAWRAARQWRTLITEPAERLRLFLWLWVLVPVIFFSFSGSKLPGYILPIFPAAAMLIALELEGWWLELSFNPAAPHEIDQDETRQWVDVKRRLALLSAGTVLLLLIVAGGVGWQASQELMAPQSAAWAVSGLTVAVTVIYCYLLGPHKLDWYWSDRIIWWPGRVWSPGRFQTRFSFVKTVIPSPRAATLFLPFGLMLMVISSIHLLLPGLGTTESMRELSLTAARVAQPGERLAFYINNEQSINFYAPDLPLRDARAGLVTAMSPTEIAALLEVQSRESLLVIALERWSLDVIYDERMDAEVLARQERQGPGRSLILMRTRLRKQSRRQ